jgi:hypothetical protein
MLFTAHPLHCCCPYQPTQQQSSCACPPKAGTSKALSVESTIICTAWCYQLTMAAGRLTSSVPWHTSTTGALMSLPAAAAAAVRWLHTGMCSVQHTAQPSILCSQDTLHQEVHRISQLHASVPCAAPCFVQCTISLHAAVAAAAAAALNTVLDLGCSTACCWSAACPTPIIQSAAQHYACSLCRTAWPLYCMAFIKAISHIHITHLGSKLQVLLVSFMSQPHPAVRSTITPCMQLRQIHPTIKPEHSLGVKAPSAACQFHVPPPPRSALRNALLH